MRITYLAAFASLFTFINGAPAPGVHTVFVTAYTTVIVDQSGVTHTPTLATTETADAGAGANTDEAALSTTSISDVAPPTTLTSQNILPSDSNTIAESPSSSSPLQSQSLAVSSSEPSGSVQSGEGTYYSTGMGACGVTSQDSDYIIAISHELYDEHDVDNNPNHNPLCGRKIRAHYQGKSVDVKVVDRCEGCAYNDLDFSPSAFTQLADKSLGRIDITWEWL